MTSVKSMQAELEKEKKIKSSNKFNRPTRAKDQRTKIYDENDSAILICLDTIIN